MRSPPSVSVVINTLLGRPYTERCIDALLTQEDAPPLEIIVPVCLPFDNVEHLREAYPDVRLPVISKLPPGADPSHPSFAHLIYDRRRAVGLAVATADIIALTEDQVVPDPHWCASIAEAHAAAPYGAIGGAVENGGTGVLHRALYLCDFGRYQRPFRARETAYLTDQNVSYKRAAIEKVRHIWSEMYHETAVHEALRNAGEKLWLTPQCVVCLRRGELRLFQQLRERCAWGRVFGGTRARRVSARHRAALLLLSPAIPLLIVFRLLKGNSSTEVLLALPVISLMAFSWTLGEAVGYATARPFPNSRGFKFTEST
jgi:hypothetical protein